ncbi:hypothetical protein EVAR_66323_1 [Eumeta japonica]|uniref:Uncharacterized protein n=1 Tax=Eumeta variegata TaxID=151549 RepID=A0A4C1Z0C5_EUMVA|nr:hypothetical protein EVAR_66323_1 [Eumeta japonica]
MCLGDEQTASNAAVREAGRGRRSQPMHTNAARNKHPDFTSAAPAPARAAHALRTPSDSKDISSLHTTARG